MMWQSFALRCKACLVVACWCAAVAGATPAAGQEGTPQTRPQQQQPASGDDTPGIVSQRPASGQFVEIGDGRFMVPYPATIPGTGITFEMVPVPGGSFRMGSPEDEPGRRDDEGPQVEIQVDPFWIGKYEVTWAEYQEYMALHEYFKEFQAQSIRQVTEERKVDAVTAPSSLYDPGFTYDAGDDPRQPAATMTQYAAKQYTKWLSILSGQFYRLPGEAEWEYACRAGTTTPWSFGDDPDAIGDYAWLDDNADYERHAVGGKKPNPWGLYDMHGNVAEWVLDQYDENGFTHLDPSRPVNAIEAIRWPVAPDPCVVRGGSFEMTAGDLRSAARLASNNEEWKLEDPNVPKSPWWFTTEPATGVGFRIVRPLNPPAERPERERYWEATNDRDRSAIRIRIESEGRGAEGLVDPDLPAAIDRLEEGGSGDGGKDGGGND